MDIIVSLLVAVHVIVCLLLVVIVLMQRPKQEGLGAAFGGGMTDQMFGAQTTDVLQKGTVWLSVMFFVITMVLAILVSKQNSGVSSLSETLGASDAPAAVEESDGLPVLPKAEQLIGVPAAVKDAAGDATDAVKETAGEAKAAAGDAAAAVKDAAAPKKADKPAVPKPAPAGEAGASGSGSSE